MGKVKCLECGAILESKYRHDFVMCKCPQGTFVDGGNDYLRCGGMDLNKIGTFLEDGTLKLSEGEEECKK